MVPFASHARTASKLSWAIMNSAFLQLCGRVVQACQRTDLKTIRQLDKDDWAYLKGLPKFKLTVTPILFLFMVDSFRTALDEATCEITTSIQVIDAQGNPAKRSDAPMPAWADG